MSKKPIGELLLNSSVVIGSKEYTIYTRTPGLVRLRNNSGETIDVNSDVYVADDKLHNHKPTWQL